MALSIIDKLNEWVDPFKAWITKNPRLDSALSKRG